MSTRKRTRPGRQDVAQQPASGSQPAFYCKQLRVDRILDLRAQELRKNMPGESARFPEDGDPETFHFAALVRAERPNSGEQLTDLPSAFRKEHRSSRSNSELRSMSRAEPGSHSDLHSDSESRSDSRSSAEAGSETGMGECDSHAVAGCLTLIRKSDQPIATWQLRGMATHHAWQNRGVGGELLAYAESFLTNRFGAWQIWCNAREHAVPFYRNRGYRVVSDRFQIDPIGPHFRMEKTGPRRR